MRTQRPKWDSPKAQAFIAARDVGGLIRWAREAQGWRQADLGQAVGYSTSTVSRLETSPRPRTDTETLRRFADVLFIPGDVLGAVLGVTAPARTKVSTTVGSQAEEDLMRRRTLLQAAGLTVPSHVLRSVDESLVLLPAPAAPPTDENLLSQLRRARQLFDAGDHARLFSGLPGLLATAHACAEREDQTSYARLASCYDLATEALSKIGRYSAARITADRSKLFAELSGSPLAAASSARAFSIVLRHENLGELAQKVTLAAAAKIEATGLPTDAEAGAFAQMLCTCSYTAAQAGDRDRALEMIRDAERAAGQLPQHTAGDRIFTVTPATVALYKVGVLWSLGDAGTAVRVGSSLNPRQLPTTERRGRLHTDLARAWWQWGKPEQTAHALLAATREAPSEVRDRPSIRAIVTGLAERHPRTSGVRELLAAVPPR